MRRRHFLTLLGGASVYWPLATRAQPGMRRIGVLMNLAADDAEGQVRLAAFVHGLQQLGWTDGRNVQIDVRWVAGDARLFHGYADELLALAPDAILASATPQRPSTPAGDRHRAHRVRERQRPGRHGFGCEPRAPRREYHRLYP